jgi:GNAT superfamily N-acetyltransferase
MSTTQLEPTSRDGYLVETDTLIRLGNGSIDKGRARLRLLLADEQERRPISGPVTKPENVRLATIRDEPAILDLLLEDLAENASAVAPVSISRIMQQVEVGTRGRGGFTAVIDGADGSPIAVAVLAPEKWWWSDALYLREIVLYVSPEARRARAGSDLLQFECWLADEMTRASGHQVFTMAGVTATRRGAAKLRLYGRYMNPVGGFFVYPAIEGLTT